MVFLSLCVALEQLEEPSGISEELYIARCFIMRKLGHRQTSGQLQMCASLCVCLQKACDC